MFDWVDDLGEAVWAGIGFSFCAAVLFVIGVLVWMCFDALWPASAAERGVASVYTDTRTACGPRFDRRAFTAAHRTLPCGTRVKIVTNQGRSVIVRITDRGPWVRGRIIDVTPAVAHALAIDGLATVRLEVCKGFGSCGVGLN